MNNILQITQIAVSIILVTTILLQQRGAALGSGFGGEGGTFYSTRRGIEKWIYWITIVSAVLFLALAIANLII
jgi:preprotein translocase subunit SecG